MYVEKKKIGRKTYNYLKMSVRVGDKVKTKTIAYLGKEPMSKDCIQKKILTIPKSKIKSIKKELKDTLLNINKEFLSDVQLKKLEQLKKDFNKKLKILDKKLLDDMFKDFKTYYIFNTNAIEGNSLTLQETSLLLNDNKSPEGKDLREIFDHINEKEVFDCILKNKSDITIKLIIDIHSRLLKNIDNRVGFRKHNVRVFGADFKTSDAKYVFTDMDILLRWFNKNKRKLHPLILASLFHEKFERIHPFYDGNGRTGRMLLNIILLNNGFPPLIIKNSSRKEYYKVLDLGHKVDLTKTQSESYNVIVNFCYDQLLETFDEIFSKWG